MTTRRTFLKSAAALLLAPAIRLRPEVTAESLMLLFCRRSDFGIYTISEPFAVAGLTYATDARSAIRAPLPCPQRSGKEVRLPPIVDVFEKYWCETRWQDFTLPHWSEVKLKPSPVPVCPACGGRRASVGDQYPPHEWVQSQWASDYGYEVDSNTIRDSSCELCRGLKYIGPCEIEVIGVRFDYSSLPRVAALPNVRVCRSAADEHALLFRADGFEGIHLGVVK